jgi:hypothetical protein
MNPSLKAWLTWSITAFSVWLVVFLIVYKLKGAAAIHQLLLVFAGYCIAWVSLTIKFVLIIKP